MKGQNGKRKLRKEQKNKTKRTKKVFYCFSDRKIKALGRNGALLLPKMIIRVRTQLGVWKVKDVSPSDTILQVKQR